MKWFNDKKILPGNPGCMVEEIEDKQRDGSKF